MSTGALSAALSSLGIHCEVEEQGKLAVIIPTAGVSLDAKTRRTIVVLGRTHGFTNVCLELSPGV